MGQNQPEPVAPAPLPGVTVEELPRHLRMHRITEQELIALAGIKTGTHLAFFGITLGAFIAFFIVLRTVNPLSERDYNLFFVLCWVTVLLCVFFAVMACIEFRNSRSLVAAIRGRQDN